MGEDTVLPSGSALLIETLSNTSATAPLTPTLSPHEERGEGEEGAGEECHLVTHSRQPECSATTPPVIARWETRFKPAARIMSAKAGAAGKLRIDSTR